METETPPPERRLWQYRAVKDALWIGGGLGLVVLGAQLSLVTVPLLMGLMLAYLIEPLLAWLCARHRRLTRGRALALVVAAVLLVAAGAVALVVPPTVRQAVEFSHNVPHHLATARTWTTAPARPAWLRERIAPLTNLLPGAAPAAATAAAVKAADPAGIAAGTLDEQRVRALVREELAAARQQDQGGTLAKVVGSATLQALGVLGALLGGAVQLGVLVVVTAFSFAAFSLNWPEITAFLRSLVPGARRERVLGLAGRMDTVVAAFVRGRLMVAAMVGVIYGIGWTVVDVPYGLALGLAVGVLSIVPYLAAIGLPLAWVLVAVDAVGRTSADGTWYVAAGADGALAVVWWKVLVLPSVVNFVAQSVEDYVLTPLIQGNATRLHPLAIMVAVIAGGSLAGIYGMLLAVPAAACLRILAEEEILPRIRGRAP
jgi:predicted PurR-regulated permease PerM